MRQNLNKYLNRYKREIRYLNCNACWKTSGLSAALATTMLINFFVPEAFAEGHNKPAIQTPYLQAPIKFEQPGKKPLSPAELAALNTALIGSDGKLATGTDEFVDLAFGAYQRGYYLSAFKLALPRAESGDPAAQTLIAELYDKGQGVALDKNKAVSWYRFAAKGGNREAQFAYANILTKGKLVPLDKKEAMTFMKLAADAGHNKAQFNVAQMIIANKPLYKGFVEARPYYENAAKGGLPDAQYVLARMYATGQGVPGTDLIRARKWMTLAAIGGFDTAQLELAIWMAIGKGGPRDEKAALDWFKLAANQGNVIAQNRLARMYAYGLGTDKDLQTASIWHVLARRAGKSDRQLDEIFRNLSNEDQRRAIRSANSWRTR